MTENQQPHPVHIAIRTFNLATDFTAVSDLWAHAGSGIHLRQSDEVSEIQKKLQRDPDLFLVAELDSVLCGQEAGEIVQHNQPESRKIIGAVLGGFDGRRGMVYHLAVAAAYRKQGIGRQLMEVLENRLRYKGCIRSYLLVTADNHEAIQFYKAQNWEQMDLFAYGKDLV